LSSIVLDLMLLFFFHDTSPSVFYTLSLHDALPICDRPLGDPDRGRDPQGAPAAGGLILSSLFTLVGRLPAGAGAWLGRRLGDLAFVVLRERRRVALANLSIAFPTLGAAERRRVGRRSFQHLGLL